MARLAVLLIRCYQKIISPLIPGRCCRFTPSCSHYGVEAYQRYGFLKGSFLVIKRLSRCHPWSPGGHDPVP